MLTKMEQMVQKANVVDSPESHGNLIDFLSKKRVVMLGESTHGTKEFYTVRKKITLELIEKHGFDFIAVEGDWPAFQKVNQAVSHEFQQGTSTINAHDVLSNFKRWPTWLWSNYEMAGFLNELKRINQRRLLNDGVFIYGLDVYSLFESIDLVLKQLGDVSPEHAAVAREKYSCLLPYQRNEKAYTRSLAQLPKGCEEQVVTVLSDILKLKMDHHWVHHKALFDAEQNARIVRNAESYYRSMMEVCDTSWNIRDEHMLETLNSLLVRHGPNARAVIWAHNTHVGDYRATHMVLDGLVNLGGLAREEFGSDQVALVGFSTNKGTTLASGAWDGPTVKTKLNAARKGSIEYLCAETQMPEFYIIMDDDLKTGPLNEAIDHRAIGVVYNPEHEGRRNYTPTVLPMRYDAFYFINETSALDQIEQAFDLKRYPETYPLGL